MGESTRKCLRNTAKKYCNAAMLKSRLQEEIIDRMAHPQVLRCIFEPRPEVYFFVKHDSGRILTAAGS